MRSHPLRLLSALGLLLLLAASGAPLLASQRALASSGASVHIDDPGTLRPGGTTDLIVRVQMLAGQDHPLLLTPRVEGVAVEAVRGRLLRSDARAHAHGAGELRFALPLRVREPGTAIVRVQLLTYHCEARCVPVHTETSRTLRVQ